MNLHVIGLPHTRFTPEYSWCAYTGKVERFAHMMYPVANVLTYGNGPATLPGTYVQVTDEQYSPFFIPEFSSDSPEFAYFNNHAIVELLDRLTPGDLILLIGGRAQQPIADAFPSYKSVEFGIGYEGIFSQYKIFESYTWQHYVFGMNHWWGSEYDTVIPNYYNPDDFTTSDDRTYFAFLGRVDWSKGIDIAIQACRQANVPLKIAGHILPNSEYVAELPEYVGSITPAERKEFLSHAIATICPTRFIEPFCGVHAESLLSGTPVIASDWGYFTESDVTTCRTLSDFIEAIPKATPDPSIRDRAISRYSYDAIRPQYMRYFERLN